MKLYRMAQELRDRAKKKEPVDSSIVLQGRIEKE